MIVDLRALRVGPQLFEGTEPASVLELEGDFYVAPGGAIGYALSIERVQDRLLVHGTVDSAAFSS